MDKNSLHRLISQWCDAAIDTDQLTQLQRELSQSSDARREFLAYMDIHSGIHGHMLGKESLLAILDDSGLVGACAATPAESQRNPQASHGSWAFGVLFALAASLMIGYVFWGGNSSSDQSAASPEFVASGANTSPRALAKVITTSADCQWYLESHTQQAVGNPVMAGDTVRVTQGSLKLGFDNGTEMTLHSPGVVQVLSAMQARVWLGKITAKVTEGGEGFSVITPRAKVIDLGTQFGVEVDSKGATDVVVFEGAVDLDYFPQDASDNQLKRLTMGEAMRFDSLGTPSRIVSISNQRFYEGEDLQPARPRVISAVFDNIQRDQSWNYYEIVHAGMREDALAYVDREFHQYNGLDANGMPGYLIGGDYVKMFNNDKVNRDVRIFVHIDVPARLYVLYDNRLEQHLPKWLTDEFTDTGDDIGIDVGPFLLASGVLDTKQQPGIGPGVSVDDVLSIWVREVQEPGVVRLGANEAPESGPNMYGIVAVPLDVVE